MKKFLNWLIVGFIFSTLAGCKVADFAGLKAIALSPPVQSSKKVFSKKEHNLTNPSVIDSILDSRSLPVKLDSGVPEAVSAAVKSDFKVLAAREQAQSQISLVKMTESGKALQLSGSLYGGIEDVTDETAGLAIVLSGNRVLYDGGFLDSTISAQSYKAAALQNKYYS